MRSEEKQVNVMLMAAMAYVLEAHMYSDLTQSSSSYFLPTPVPLTLLQKNALSPSAVCLDGTSPGYHLLSGYGSGSRSWIIQLEGGGWCDDIKSCVFRKTTHRGSSLFMEKYINFTGILSDRPLENPDFFNWNKVKIRYCDGASFTGEAQNQKEKLYFRGEKIWRGVIDELLSKGMSFASQALLSGCSAGGLASILHCDNFKSLLPNHTSVKCLSDAGFFLDVVDVAGRDTIRNMYRGVVSLQGSEKNLPVICTDHLDPASCFFPQNLISGIKTPLFILNSAYDSWQVKNSLVPSSADPEGHWDDCKANHTKCNSTQIELFQNFRSRMLKTLLDFGNSPGTGLFINSCFSHCHSEGYNTWFAEDSPRIGNKRVAEAVGDWFFERENGGEPRIDLPYPSDGTCIHDM